MAKKELEKLKKKVETERKKYEEDVETKKLKQELFRLNHRKTVKIAFNIENIAKGLGKMMIGVGKKLGEMDKELTEKISIIGSGMFFWSGQTICIVFSSRLKRLMKLLPAVTPIP